MRLYELEAPKDGVYVAVRFSDQTVSKLKRYQEEHEIPNPLGEDDFHTTIVYSRVPIDWTPAVDIDLEAKATGFQIWDTRSEKRCLVLEIKSDYLQDRFDEAIDAGATHDFDDYRPHITLSYDVGDFDSADLPVPDFGIEIKKEYKEPLRGE